MSQSSVWALESSPRWGTLMGWVRGRQGAERVAAGMGQAQCLTTGGWGQPPPPLTSPRFALALLRAPLNVTPPPVEHQRGAPTCSLATSEPVRSAGPCPHPQADRPRPPEDSIKAAGRRPLERRSPGTGVPDGRGVGGENRSKSTED